MSTKLGSKDLGIRHFEFLAETLLIPEINSLGINMKKL